MLQKKRLVVVPRWSGTPSSDYYPWLVGQLNDSAVLCPVLIGDMPHPSAPTIETWPKTLREIAGEDPDVLRETIMMGHSVGAQTVLHFLAALPEGVQVAAAVLVAGWWDVDKPWDSIRPWIAHEHDHERIKRAAKSIHVLLSDNDPFTSDHTRTAELFRSRLDARVVMVPGAKHFNGTEEPAVLELLTKVASEA